MIQEKVVIAGVEIPIIKEGGEIYYPINFTLEKVLKKSFSTKDNITYLSRINIKSIEFTRNSFSDTKCFTYENFKYYFENKNFNFQTFNDMYIARYNGIMKYFSIDRTIKIPYLKNYNIKLNKKEYTDDAYNYINNFIKDSQNIIWKCCCTCHKYYPLHINFFNKDTRKIDKYFSYCKCCQSKKNEFEYWKLTIKDKNYEIIKKYGVEAYKLINNHNEFVIKIYKDWLDGKLTVSLPRIINNKNDFFIILRYLHDNNYLTKDNLSWSVLERKYGMNCSKYNVLINDIYKFLFGNEPWEKPWKYPNFRLIDISFEQARNIFNNYLTENNIKIKDVFKFNYYDYCCKCGLRGYISNMGVLEFAIFYNDEKYPAYKFKIPSKKYWQSRENRVQALKYFIEEDMKLNIDKLPLYLTKMLLQRNARSLYYLLYKKTYYNNLYEWVNDVYPNKFDKYDFNINKYRDDFDSNEEMMINEILKESNLNIIYNSRKSENPICINGMYPDWVAHTNNGCYLIEYFGLYVHRGRNSIIDDYIKRTEKKLIKYKKLNESGYKFIALYPDDIKDNFNGVKTKINKIQN